MVLLDPLAALVPAELVAVTVNEYDVLELNPVTEIGELAPDPEPPPEVVYPVIVAPPLSEGGVNATVAVDVPVAVAVPIVGANGTLAATADVELEVPFALPWVFVPVTTQLIADPASAETSV